MPVHPVPTPATGPGHARVLPLVRAALAGHAGTGPVVVGIDGRSGAGKTDLAAELVTALRTETGLADDGVVLFALEDVYRGWNGLAVGLGAVAAGLLEPLSRGLTGRLRRYDWHAGEVDGLVEVPPPGAPLPRVLVLEGCGAGSAICAPFVDVLVWLDAPADVRRRRAMERDEGSWTQMWDVWAEQESALLTARDARAAADLIIRT
ncbi:AAA family ATPase [Georgenia halophila]|uniref:AAA family ATPase n=1 Tax=Georgenia halophila TaxID=620889 RepID=A0ABP8L426_9MICO